MSDKPIIFSAPMIAALLAGTKTQTRRVLKPQPVVDGTTVTSPPHFHFHAKSVEERDRYLADISAYAPGDRLWVREAHAMLPATAYRASIGVGTIAQREHPTDGYTAAVFREGFDRSGRPRWRPSIHMPRWASRLTLVVSDVRVQRLNDISKDDAKAEGLTRNPLAGPQATALDCDWSFGGSMGHGSAVSAFAALWETIHGPGSWTANPWVCALTFDVLRCNIDDAGA